MRTGLTISSVGHVAVLMCAFIAISAQPMDAPHVDSLPVQFISDKDFTQMTRGAKNAPQLKVPDLKPLADKVDAEKPVEQLAPKVADKPEVTTQTSQPKTTPKSDPKPDPKQADKTPKPPQPPPPKPDAKTADKPDKPAPDYKPDQIADILKKDAAKDPPKVDPNQNKDAPKFDANQVAQLLDKREPQRQVAAAQTVNDTSTLGAATGAQAAQLSQSEIDALRARISSCWSPPAGVNVNSRLYIVLRVIFKPDGSLAGEPAVVEGTASALGPALADSARRALLMCQPFTMLKPDHYDQWRDLELKFDPHELLGG
jgi:colicin import membrane protein